MNFYYEITNNRNEKLESDSKCLCVRVNKELVDAKRRRIENKNHFSCYSALIMFVDFCVCFILRLRARNIVHANYLSSLSENSGNGVRDRKRQRQIYERTLSGYPG